MTPEIYQVDYVASTDFDHDRFMKKYGADLRRAIEAIRKQGQYTIMY